MTCRPLLTATGILAAQGEEPVSIIGADSLVINVAELTFDHPGPAASGVITLFGITAMTGADIHATTWPVFDA